MKNNRALKLITWILALIMAIGAMPLSASASEDDQVTVIVKADTINDGELFRGSTGLEETDTLITLLQKALGENGSVNISFYEGGTPYVSAITIDGTTYNEKEYGSDESGWMYTVDGLEWGYELRNDSEIVFYYSYKGWGKDQSLLDSIMKLYDTVSNAAAGADTAQALLKLNEYESFSGNNIDYIDYIVGRSAKDSYGAISDECNEIEDLIDGIESYIPVDKIIITPGNPENIYFTGQKYQFTASLYDAYWGIPSDTDFIWKVEAGRENGAASPGAIDADGIFTPGSAGNVIISVMHPDKTMDHPIEVAESSVQNVCFEISGASDPQIFLERKNDTVFNADNAKIDDFNYQLSSGDYAYTVADGEKTPVSGDFTVKNEDMTISLTIADKSTIVNTLLNNISEVYSSLTSNPWYVIGVQANEDHNPATPNKYSNDSIKQYINNAIAAIADEHVSDSTLAMNIIGLKSIGIDASDLISLNKTPVNAVEKLKSIAAYSADANAFRLLAYLQDEYASDLEKRDIIDSIIDAQNANGSYPGWDGDSPDSTATVIASLASFYPAGEADTYNVKDAVDKAVAYLSTIQKNDGSINNNSNSTAMAIIGLAAVGIDPDTDERFIKTENRNSLLDGLLYFRTKDNDGFGWMNQKFNDLATQQSFLALISASEIKENGQPYNVFDFSFNASEQGVATAAGEADDDETDDNYTAPQIGENTITVTFTLRDVPSAFSDQITVNAGATIKDVFRKAMSERGIPYTLSGGYYVSTIDGLSQFDGGENSGWMYMVNGSHPVAGIAVYEVEDGDVIVFHFSDDFTKEEGSEQWNGTPGGEETATAGSGNDPVIIPYTKQGTTVKLGINDDILEELLDSGSEDGALVIDASGISDTFEISMPADALEAISDSDGINSFSIVLPSGELTFDDAALNSLLEEAGSGTVTFGCREIDNNELSNKQKEAAGDRPVYDISIMSGRTAITGFDGVLTVSLPYTLKEGEKASGIVIYHLDSSGNLVKEEGIYDPATGKVTFKVDHLSYFVIGYDSSLVKWPFNDVAESDDINWFYSAVKYVYENGIFSGTSESTFGPNEPMTRAMLAAVLARMSKEDLSVYNNSRFSDIKADSWYGQSVAWAEKAGIVSGFKEKDGRFAFRPDEHISRQDMALMMKKYAEKYDPDALKKTKDSIKFSDEGIVSEYAKDAVMTMQQAGIINGVKNADGSYSFLPVNKAARAETAVLIRNMMIK